MSIGLRRRASDRFEYGRNTLAAADALRGERVAPAVALQQLRRLADQTCAGRPERMADRKTAAVQVDARFVEFELARPRWYWFDEKPVQLSQTYRISYTPLLRQYRLSVGSVYQNFTRFEEVTRVLSRLRGWHVAEKGALKKDQVYQASVRMRLDTAQLPKPFQLNAISSRDWTLDSDWHRWTITP